MKKSRICAYLLAGASIAGPSMAFAAEPAAPAAAKQSSSTEVSPEIIVTALKRSESSLKVPVSLTVLNGGDLKTQGVNNVADIQNIVPGVNISTGRDGVQVQIRGVTTSDTSAKGEQDVAFNIDGVYVGRGNARGAAFFDVERVEVLRGPQGTLYGRSSTGGAVNVVTVAPKLGVTGGYVKAEYGNYNAKRAEGAVNFPLTDTVAVRFSGAYNRRDGFSRPIPTTATGSSVSGGTTTVNIAANQGYARNDQDDATGRASLLFQPSDALSLRLTATVGHQGGAGNSAVLQTQMQAGNDTGPAALQILANPIKPFVNSNFTNYDAHLNVRLGGNVQLDALASYQWMHFVQRGATVNAPGQANLFLYNFALNQYGGINNRGGAGWGFYLQDNRVKTKQAEVRISNVDPARLDYVVGANWYDEAAGEAGQSWGAFLDAPYNESGYAFNAGPVNTTTHKAYGVFGQGTYHLTDTLGLIGGLRYTHNEINRVGRFSLPVQLPPGFVPGFGPVFVPWSDAAGNAICTYPNPCLGPQNPGGSSDSKVTFRVGLNWQVTPRHLIYGSVASGFKGGTFNDYDPATGGSSQVAPSNLIAYEIGYKGRPLNNLTLSSSAYYYDFSKYQLTGQVTFPGNNIVIYTSSTPAVMYGLENELAYQVARHTTLTGNLTLSHSELKSFIAGQYAYQGYGVSFAGKPVDQAPVFTASLGLNHTVDLANGGALRFNGLLKYSDGYFLTDYANAVRYRQKAFTRSNASLTYEPKGGSFSIQAFVENIENKIQRTGALAGYVGGYGGAGGSTGAPSSGTFAIGNGQISGVPANYMTFQPTSPRFYGIRLGAKF